jgi:hypothetical protein
VNHFLVKWTPDELRFAARREWNRWKMGTIPR